MFQKREESDPKFYNLTNKIQSFFFDFLITNFQNGEGKGERNNLSWLLNISINLCFFVHKCILWSVNFLQVYILFIEKHVWYCSPFVS